MNKVTLRMKNIKIIKSWYFISIFVQTRTLALLQEFGLCNKYDKQCPNSKFSYFVIFIIFFVVFCNLCFIFFQIFMMSFFNGPSLKELCKPYLAFLQEVCSIKISLAGNFSFYTSLVMAKLSKLIFLTCPFSQT